MAFSVRGDTVERLLISVPSGHMLLRPFC